ncbi:MAG: ATPase [Alphaproteobacteria bacterium]|nr:ATPase [Alphaproteobacteria bacterium]MBL7100102.1 ATPase [Alphaproteobacteria bacterium]
MKRFYKSVTVGDDAAILLDNRPVRTPAGNRLALPTRALADAIAQEWKEQGDTVVPASMPLTKFANTTLDGIARNRAAVAAELASYGGNDLLCYRAEDEPLAIRQAAHWDAILDWAHETHGARLTTASGVIHVPQTPGSQTALAKAVEALDDWTLAGLQPLVTITGSLVLALAVAAGRLTPAQGFVLSRVDEDFQAEKWGVDDEARERAENLAAEIEIAAKFIALARA